MVIATHQVLLLLFSTQNTHTQTHTGATYAHWHTYRATKKEISKRELLIRLDSDIYEVCMTVHVPGPVFSHARVVLYSTST